VTSIAKWQGRIIVGTEFHGVWQRIDGKLAPLAAPGLPDRRVHGLAVDSDGRLWVATFSGVASLDAENPNTAVGTSAATNAPAPQKDETKDTPPETEKPRQWKPLPLPLKPRTPDEDKVALSPQSQAVLSLCTDTKGRIWMGTRTEGIFRCDPKAGTWERLGRKEGLPDMFVRCLAMDSAGFLWVGTYGGGIAVFEPEEFRLRSHGGWLGSSPASRAESAAGRLAL
jgi:ligand-binding sensor domain-containing protein